MEIVITAAIAGTAGLVLGLLLGRGGALGKGRQEGMTEGMAEGRAAADARIRAAAEAISRGRIPDDAKPGSAEADLHDALRSGWTPREAEFQSALQASLGRMGRFLERNVKAPLAGAGPEADAGELRERIDRALGGLQDLESFLEEPPTEVEGQNVSALVQQVTREFARDQDVTVRMRMEGPVRARVNPQGLMDALYLVLHNAARFGADGRVDVTVLSEDARAVVRVRDHGKGFSEEAFKRAFDPFYSTTADGLGLGLPHARKSIEAMGGRIELRNAPDGGAEVEVSFPKA